MMSWFGNEGKRERRDERKTFAREMGARIRFDNGDGCLDAEARARKGAGLSFVLDTQTVDVHINPTRSLHQELPFGTEAATTRAIRKRGLKLPCFLLLH